MGTVKEAFLDAIKRIKSLKDGLNAYAYFDDNWWVIAVDDYDFYREDPEFKRLSNEIRSEMKETHDIKVIFVYRIANDKVFKKLTNNNLIRE